MSEAQHKFRQGQDMPAGYCGCGFYMYSACHEGFAPSIEIARLQQSLRDSEAALSATREQLRRAQANNHARNVELDALHYVWCDGGCRGGVHRFGEHPPLTAEIVAAAERNTERLRRWFVSQAGKVGPPTWEERRAYWTNADVEIERAKTAAAQQRVEELERALRIAADELNKCGRAGAAANANIVARGHKPEAFEITEGNTEC